MAVFSSSNDGLPEDVGFVGEKVLGDFSARGPPDEVSLVGDIVCAMVVVWASSAEDAMR
jgi:hypothetical protein